MNKQEFLNELRKRLSPLDEQDIESSLEYYSEMIDDRIEEGLTEEKAVEAIGSVEDIASQILLDTPLPKLIKSKMKPNRALRVWEIVLIILGAPMWLPLLIALIVIILSVYIVMWSVIISLYSSAIAVAASGIGVFLGSFVLLFTGNILSGFFAIGSGLFCVGLSILMFLGCNIITKYTFILSKKIPKWIKSLFISKEKER